MYLHILRIPKLEILRGTDQKNFLKFGREKAECDQALRAMDLETV